MKLSNELPTDTWATFEVLIINIYLQRWDFEFGFQIPNPTSLQKDVHYDEVQIFKY